MKADIPKKWGKHDYMRMDYAKDMLFSWGCAQEVMKEMANVKPSLQTETQIERYSGSDIESQKTDQNEVRHQI